MRKLILSLVVISAITFFSGCTKSGDGPSGPAAILTSGKWQLKSAESVVTFPGIGSQTLDMLEFSPSCYNDNLGIFNADGTITTDEGPTKCDASAPQTKTEGTWKFSSDNTKLTISDPLANSPLTVLTADVLALNESTMKLHLKIVGQGGATSETTYQYNHIK